MLSDFDLSLRCSVSPTVVKSSNSTLASKHSVYCAQPACLQPTCVMQPDCIQPTCFGPRLFPSKSKKEKKSKIKSETNQQVSPLPELIAEPTNARSMSFVGTHEYLAPEIIKGQGHGSAVDWWTFGIFLYELLFGKTPFKGAENRATLFNVIGQPLRFPEYPNVSFAAKDLIRGLLVKEPQHRLAYRRGATEVKQHAFFQSVNWALIRCANPPEVPKPSMTDFFAGTNVAKAPTNNMVPGLDVKPSGSVNGGTYICLSPKLRFSFRISYPEPKQPFPALSLPRLDSSNSLFRSWLIDSRSIAKKVKNAIQITDPDCGANRECPNCHCRIDNSDVSPQWPGFPIGLKFDPSDIELLEHLAAKCGVGDLKPHPFIDEFISTLNEDQGICYTHPQNLPGVKKDGSSIHFFHQTINAYATGQRKRRRIQNLHSTIEEHVRWHKTGKTKPVIENGVRKGWKKIMVLYKRSNRAHKSEKSNWVMHQYHLGAEEVEVGGEYVVSKISYQQPKQTDKNDGVTRMEDSDNSMIRASPRTPKTMTRSPPWPWESMIYEDDIDEKVHQVLGVLLFMN
ncbi:hypothetical protein Goari_013392 [Gossypium aridum]|uniref:non-specific serine/threonine protein kinase n=1 Tax=Gossypium aridum TaxID=34290 RepID=A0A7J8XFS3_GOSAI|nr:hypothetical protein [Gossypium aridum]